MAAMMPFSMLFTIALLCVVNFRSSVSYSSSIISRIRSDSADLQIHGPRLSRLYARMYGIADSRARKQAPPPLAPINENIKATEVRLIVPVEDGEPGEEENLGVFPIDEALYKAEQLGLDLVLINENSDPPVCKVIDYGKYKYAQDKKKKEISKKNVKNDIKEVKMSYKIDTHDFDVRVRSAQRFLKAGDRVKVLVQFRGREMQHTELGRDLLNRVSTQLQDIGNVDGVPAFEGRAIAMFMSPKPKT